METNNTNKKWIRPSVEEIKAYISDDYRIFLYADECEIEEIKRHRIHILLPSNISENKLIELCSKIQEVLSEELNILSIKKIPKNYH